MLKKLRLKFVCTIMAVVTVMLSILMGLVIFFMGQSLEYQSLRMMQTLAQEPFLAAPPQNMEERGEELPIFTVQLSRDGELLKTGGAYPENIDDGTILQIVQSVRDSQGPSGTLEDYNLRYYRAMRPRGETMVFADLSGEQAAMANLVKICVFLGLGCFALFLGLSLLLVRWMVRPVEAAWQQQKQFVADASHELKTPLTVIMTNAELLQEQTETGQETWQFSDSILTMSRQMRGLVEGLLELARVDNGAVETTFGPMDLSELVSDCLLPFEPLFFERELVLEAEVEPDIRIRGSERHLHQVADILLDNAMKYSAPGGTVRVRLRRQLGTCLLTVASPGEALDRQQLRDIFKRFYRVDKARSRDGSYGLGLSIAQRIVEEHRGRIWAESSPGVNTFCVQLPMS